MNDRIQSYLLSVTFILVATLAFTLMEYLVATERKMAYSNMMLENLDSRFAAIEDLIGEKHGS